MNAPVVPEAELPYFDPEQVNVDPYTVDLAEYDVSNHHLFEANVQERWFKRLRDEAPVHYCAESEFGPYWSITRYEDIMKVDTSHQIFSSEPAITIRDQREHFQLPMFIAMDRPKHDVQRSTVSPAVGAEALRQFAPIIRERTQQVLDDLPVGEAFDWVDNVSIELTTRMLATLFDFPFTAKLGAGVWAPHFC